MKNSIGKFLFIFGTFLTLACPLYQFVDSIIHNREGDGKEVYGDNPIFREILGVKTTYHYFEPSSGWESTGEVDIQTPKWMQNIGLPEIVHYGGYEGYDGQDTASKEEIKVILLRIGIKFIPIVLIIISLFLRREKSTSNKTKRLPKK